MKGNRPINGLRVIEEQNENQHHNQNANNNENVGNQPNQNEGIEMINNRIRINFNENNANEDGIFENRIIMEE